MESISYTSSSSSSYQKKLKMSSKSSSSSRSSLHAVHKNSFKPMKMPIAPQLRVPPKIYKVEARNFKEVVQKLTASPENRQRRLQEVAAPPPLELSSAAVQAVEQPQLLLDADNIQATVDFDDSMATETQDTAKFDDLLTETTLERDENPWKLSDTVGACSPLAFTTLSPSSQAWFSSLVFGPGALSTIT